MQPHTSHRAASPQARGTAAEWISIAMLALLCSAAPAARAHLMVAQRGTLNIVADGAYLVLSLPVSALGIGDDDGDGRLSATELGVHRTAIAAQVQQHVQLLAEGGPRPLEGVLLSLGSAHDAPRAPAAQLVVMGRFALGAPLDQSLSLKIDLARADHSEQSLQVTVRRASQTQLVMFTPERSERALFPPVTTVPADLAVSEAAPIAFGLDHAVLLLVFATGWRFRRV